jgi:hypothetical protein
MVARGELHLSGIHQLAGHLTDENHEEVLRKARCGRGAGPNAGHADTGAAAGADTGTP